MSETAVAPKQRPIVPFLKLEPDPHLAGLKCRGCGAAYLLGPRVACARCGAAEDFEPIRLGRNGTLYVYSIVHQSIPGVPTPYVSAIVDLPEGVAVRCNLIDVEPDPAKLTFGMPVEMVTRAVRTDKDATEVVAFFFQPSA